MYLYIAWRDCLPCWTAKVMGAAVFGFLACVAELPIP